MTKVISVSLAPSRALFSILVQIGVSTPAYLLQSVLESLELARCPSISLPSLLLESGTQGAAGGVGKGLTIDFPSAHTI